jgi:hypothetical protein
MEMTHFRFGHVNPVQEIIRKVQILLRYVNVIRELHVLLRDEKHIDQHVFNCTSCV